MSPVGQGNGQSCSSESNETKGFIQKRFLLGSRLALSGFLAFFKFELLALVSLFVKLMASGGGACGEGSLLRFLFILLLKRVRVGRAIGSRR